jgi:hypothetical protein
MRWMNEEKTILLIEIDGISRVLEPGLDGWEKYSSLPDIETYQPPIIPEPDPAELLAAERAAMVCTPAQMRLTLLAAGLLDQVQAIANSDPQAIIVWEYATQIVRSSPFIDALGGDNGFTPEQIDEIFRAAMQVQT